MPKIHSYDPMTTADGNDVLPVDDQSSSWATKRLSLTVLKEWFQSLAAWVGKSNVDFNSGIWWEELGRITGSGSSVTLSNIPPRTNLQLIVYATKPTTSDGLTLRLNGDTGSNYTTRVSTNGAADVTATGNTSATFLSANTNTQVLGIYNTRNLANQPKIFMGRSISDTTGVANIPDRQERILKWNNTSSQITSVTLETTGTFSSITIIVLGHD